MRKYERVALCVATCIAAATALAAPPVVKVTLPAASLKLRVNDFFDRFERDYRASVTPLPVYTLLFRSNTTPSDKSVLKKVATQPDGSARTVTFSKDGTKAISEGNAVSDAQFAFNFNGQLASVGIDVPAHLECSIAATQTGTATTALKFTLSEGLPIHLHNIKVPVKIPDTFYLVSMSVDKSSVVYEFADSASKASRSYVVKLNLDAK